jgi:hypothetical protein
MEVNFINVIKWLSSSFHKNQAKGRIATSHEAKKRNNPFMVIKYLYHHRNYDIYKLIRIFTLIIIKNNLVCVYIGWLAHRILYFNLLLTETWYTCLYEFCVKPNKWVLPSPVLVSKNNNLFCTEKETPTLVFQISNHLTFPFLLLSLHVPDLHNNPFKWAMAIDRPFLDTSWRETMSWHLISLSLSL